MHMNEERIYVLFMYNAWPCSSRSLTMSDWDRQSLSSSENQLGDKQVHISFVGREAISLSLDFLGQGKLTTELCPLLLHGGQMLQVLGSPCFRHLTLFFLLTRMVLLCWVVPALFALMFKLHLNVYAQPPSLTRLSCCLNVLCDYVVVSCVVGLFPWEKFSGC